MSRDKNKIWVNKNCEISEYKQNKEYKLESYLSLTLTVYDSVFIMNIFHIINI